MVKSISENALKNNHSKKDQTESAKPASAASGADFLFSSTTSAVILIGFMGAGKTTVGQLVARQLGWTFEDLDYRIEQREKQKVAEIFRNAGEDAFRKAEHAALQELLDELSAGPEKIIALGGGAFVQESIAMQIAATKVPTVFLDASVEELWARCALQCKEEAIERPLLGSRENFQSLYEQRRPHYMKAHFHQSTTGKSVEVIAAELIQVLRLKEPERRRRGENE